MVSIKHRLFAPIMRVLPIGIKTQLLYLSRFYKPYNPYRPLSFNEKIQFRKVNNRSILLQKVAGKLEGKEFVEKICHKILLPKTIAILDSEQAIMRLDTSLLPERFVIKSNHTSQQNLFLYRHEFDRRKVKKFFLECNKIDFCGTLGEWGYSGARRCLLIEEFLDKDGQSPDDYKFFVYHGMVHFIQVDTGRFSSHHRNMFDRNWNDLKFDYSHPRLHPPPNQPLNLLDMITLAERIAKNFDFARVDLFTVDNNIYFGEITLYPGSGLEKFPDKKFDYMFGKPWNINRLS